jgi:hypothetical protein
LNQYNIKQNYDNRSLTAVFWFGQLMMLLGGLLAGWFVYLNFQNYLESRDFVFKLVYNLLAIAFLSFGFSVPRLLLWADWHEAYSMMMIHKYEHCEPNKPISIQIIIPDGYKYEVKNMMGLFYFIKNSFKSNDVNNTTMMKYGKWHSQITFDFVVHAGEIKMYATIPKKKYTQFVEGMIRIFPGITIEIKDDPYKEWPQKWVEGNNINGMTEFSGYSFGLLNAGFNPCYKIQSMPRNPSEGPSGNLLRLVKESINHEETVILQYIFMASPDTMNAEFQDEFEHWRQRVYQEVSPTRNGKVEGEGLKSFMGAIEKDKVSAYHFRANQPLLQTSIRIGAICKRERLNFMDDLLEKAAIIFSNDGGRVGRQRPEKKHITDTHQKFFRQENLAPEFNYIYDRYIYPSKKENFIVDMYWGPLYEKLYYPNENRWRKKTNYESLIRRDIEAPWDGFEFQSDPITGAALFQLPLDSYQPGSYYQQKIQGGPPMNLYDSLYEYNAMTEE